MQLLDEILQQAGLDKTEAEVYTTLLSRGGTTVLDLSKITNLKRTNLYNVLSDLEKKDLVKKVKTEKTTKYYPNSPREVQKLFNLKETKLEMAKTTFEMLVDNLQSKYNLISHKPTVTYLEGLTGLQKLHQDILDTGQDIMLFRSTYDDKRKDVDKLIQKQILAQVKRNIHARVIGPCETDTEEVYTRYDKLRLVEERLVTDFKLFLPAQIFIYGNKIAIATIRKDIIITLIENTDIANTFKILFELVWEYSTLEHQKLTKGWVQE